MDKENMNSMKKKALAFAAAACAFGMLLSGCGSSNGDSTADKGSNVITAYNSEPQNPLIPGDCNETGGGKPLDLLFARLISFDAKGNASNEVAESIKSNDDATQYTIKLKDGWKFTDGTPVTAESFTKAWSYTANAKNAQLGSSFFSTIKGYDKLQDGDKLKGDEQLEGLKVVNEYEYGMADRQFGPLVSKVKADNPEVIYASGYYFNAGPLVSQLRAAGVTVPIIGQEGYDSEKFIDIAGPASDGTLITTSLDRDSDSPVTKTFLADFRRATGVGADMVAASSYTATSVAIEGLRKTGGKGGEALKNALASGTYDTPIGKLAFNDLHEVQKSLQVQIVKDKAFHRHSVISDAVLLAPPSKPK